jgi:hypothetical protein
VTYTQVASWVISSPPPDADLEGYEAICALQMKQTSNDELFGFKLRLVSRNLGGAPITTYTTGTAVTMGPFTPHCHHDWWPAGHGFRLGNRYETYQHRGATINTAIAGYNIDDQDHPSDLRAIYWSPVVSLDSARAAGADCEIRLEILLDVMPAVYDLSISLVASGLRCKALEVLR